MYEDFVPERLAKLRTQKGVSARDMSLSLGRYHIFKSEDTSEHKSKECGEYKVTSRYAVLFLHLRISGCDAAGIL